MTYKLACIKCGRDVLRVVVIPRPVCFACKKERQNEYQRNYKNTHKLTRGQHKKISKALRKRMIKELLKRAKKREAAKLQKIRKHATESFIRRLGGIKEGNRVKYPQVYYPKNYEHQKENKN